MIIRDDARDPVTSLKHENGEQKEELAGGNEGQYILCGGTEQFSCFECSQAAPIFLSGICMFVGR